MIDKLRCHNFIVHNKSRVECPLILNAVRTIQPIRSQQTAAFHNSKIISIFCGKNVDHSLAEYRIRPNYRTVRLGFSNLQDTHLLSNMYLSTKDTLLKRSEKDLFNDDSAIFSDFLYKGICCGYSFELHRLVDAIQMSTHNICLCKEVKKKVHWL